MDAPHTLQQAIVYFSDSDRAFQYALNFRWPNGLVTCPRCGSEKHSFIKTRKIWFCSGCKKQFTLKVGTIFEDSPIGLDKWMMTMWMLANCKNGVSSYEIARSTGVTQKTAWFMLHRIRLAMGEESGKMGGSGPVEIDETFIGGKIKNMHRSKIDRSIHPGGGTKGKAVVMGMLERGGKVRTRVIANRDQKMMEHHVKDNIAQGGHIITDEFQGYNKLKADFVHETINHLEGYVRGHVHTNGIENFWSCLKRSLHGTYISVEPFHLSRYAHEQVFRFNNRKNMDDGARFEKCMSQVSGKRLTYADLTGATLAH